MYKLSEPFDSQALESFESRVLASELKFEYSQVASQNAYSLRLARTREYSLRASGGSLTRGWHCTSVSLLSLSTSNSSSTIVLPPVSLVVLKSNCQIS